ncbi:MAG: M23 family metallopeptidase, partial [bacterium]|nr:M23 family metallopeptidase [bacterium]
MNNCRSDVSPLRIAALIILTAFGSLSGLPVTSGESAITLEGSIIQGGLVIGRTSAKSSVYLENRNLRVSTDGFFVLGFHRDTKGPEELVVTLPGGNVESRILKPEQRTYREQRINGLPPKMVTPPKELSHRLKKERELLRKAWMTDSPETWFAEGFTWPARGIITGVYGSRRILNGQPRQPHYGIDIGAPSGTRVMAPCPGVVRLAESDLYYTGGTVIIDHGHGVTSTLIHLKTILVKPGQRVAKWQMIGTVGSTGRATGPHLDWRINWFER